MTQRGLALQPPAARAVGGAGGGEPEQPRRVRRTQGRGAAAARLYAASLSINREVLPPGDARIATGAMNTGAAWLEAGRADAAEPLLQEALETLRAAFEAEPDHPTCALRRAG